MQLCCTALSAVPHSSISSAAQLYQQCSTSGLVAKQPALGLPQTDAVQSVRSASNVTTKCNDDVTDRV